MKNLLKNKKFVSISTLIFGCIMFVAGFFAPPKGVIDGSVITAMGLLFGFAASIDGFDYLRGKARIKDDE